MPATPAPRSLLVADSFRVRVHEGVAEVRGFERHLARFKASALAAADDHTDSQITERQVDAFCDEVRTRIADALESGHALANLHKNDAAPKPVGAFPRLELWKAALPSGQLRDSNAPKSNPLELSLALRALPEIRSSIEMTCAKVPQNVAHPGRKGPNLETYAALAQNLGGEALLVSNRARTGPAGASDVGHLDHEVIEGSTTSLVWWSADGQGYTVASRERVPSVTEALMSDIAHALHTPLKPASITARELLEHEVWAVNALHGIRAVQAINGVTPLGSRPESSESPESPESPVSRLNQFRLALDQTWESVRIPRR